MSSPHRNAEGQRERLPRSHPQSRIRERMTSLPARLLLALALMKRHEDATGDPCEPAALAGLPGMPTDTRGVVFLLLAGRRRGWLTVTDFGRDPGRVCYRAWRLTDAGRAELEKHRRPK